MKTGFFRNTALTMGTNTLLMLLSIVSGLISARLLQPEGRGELAAIQNWPFFLMTIGVLGLADSIVYYGSKRQGELALASTTWFLLLPASLVFMIAGYFAMPYLLAAQSAEILQAARLYLLLIPFACLNSVHFLHMSWKRFGIWNLLRLMIPGAYTVILIIAWIFAKNISAFWVARAYFVIYALYSLVVVISLRIYGPLSLRRRIPELRQPMVRFGVQSLLGSMPQLLNLRLDQLVMAAFVKPMQLGLYVVAASWSTILSGLVMAIGQTMFPQLAQLDDAQDAQRQLVQVIRFGFWVDLFLSLLMLAFTPLGVPLLFGPRYAPSVPPALILVVGSGILYLNMLFSNGLKGTGKPSAVAWAEGAGLLVTLVLLAWLLPQYGILGAAIASLVAYFTVFLILLFSLRAHTGLPLLAFFEFKSKDWSTVAGLIRQVLREGRLRCRAEDGTVT
jgi:O-antigen/teichoic acid export membrane protein